MPAGRTCMCVCVCVRVCVGGGGGGVCVGMHTCVVDDAYFLAPEFGRCPVTTRMCGLWFQENSVYEPAVAV